MIKSALLFLSFIISIVCAQNIEKKAMTPEVYDIWKVIEDPSISNDGRYVAYTLTPGKGDPTIMLHDIDGSGEVTFSRSSKPQFSYDGNLLIFLIHPFSDSLKAQRRRKVKEKDLPGDTLAIYHFSTKQLIKVPNYQSHQLPKTWSGYLAFQFKPVSDSTQIENKDSFPLVIYDWDSEMMDTIQDVSEYHIAGEYPNILLSRSEQAGVYLYDLEKRSMKTLLQEQGNYEQLHIHEQGDRVAFLLDRDTTHSQIKNYELYIWTSSEEQARMVADSGSAEVPGRWLISHHAEPNFSKDGTKLYVGIAPTPIIKDTTLLEEEIVQVEVWNYQDGRLYTQQEVRASDEAKRSYKMVYDMESQQLIPIGSEDMPEIILGDEGNSTYALGYDETPYLKYISWEGDAYRDVYWINIKNGTKESVGKKIWGNTRLSPKGKYAYWYSMPDSSWMVYHPEKKEIYNLTSQISTPFYDELNDRPMHPYPYGIAGWTEDDQHILIYDRYDIWKIDPEDPANAVNMTKGRVDSLRYRYISLDPEARFIEADAEILLHVFDEITKAEGYARLNMDSNQLTSLIQDDYAYTRNPIKARLANKLIFTKESYQLFPDLMWADTNFQSVTRISDANPQQDEYNWGTIELYEWTSLDGQALQGLLVKPEGFDPDKMYPMIVNFYEKSSNGLHNHRAPEPHRSTINYSYYTSRGYVIFNPDVPYKIGYPGESAFNAVTSGVTSLIGEGFIDKDRIGVQGHSWGGYQIAYLITRTNMFRCAESGAPVVNMMSAYGGIRWGSGMSRMFQYERTQSRIGGTLWEYPLRYIENSPIFTVDKIQTPVLILHNDEDGAVPWYQGIEFFVALRRLGKPSWMLNYNGEPHWPLKRQNRLDFNLRIQQYFDYYLQDAPKPMWMEKGVSPLQKGIQQGYELMEE